MENILYKEVNINLFTKDIQDLISNHYNEFLEFEEFAPEVDYDEYLKLQNDGVLKSVICKVNEEIIGYIIFVVKSHIHYKSCKTAFVDTYFIKKEFRKKNIGIGLLNYSENMLKRLGVDRIITHTRAKIGLDNSELLEYLGYRMTDKVFSKLLNVSN